MSVQSRDDARSMGSASSSRRAQSVVVGPTEVGGKVFLKVKRCPLCGGTNTDSNPIQGGGPFGAQRQPFLLWARGSSESPEGRYDKICAETWVLSGLCNELEDVDAFVAARKSSPQLSREWDVARQRFIEAERAGGF